jgi:hypothetical protein
MVANPSLFKLKDSRVPHFHHGDYTSNAFDDADDEAEDYESINDDCSNGEISPVALNLTKTGEVTIENPPASNNPSLSKFHSYFAGSSSHVGTPYMNISNIRETDEEDLDEDSKSNDESDQENRALKPSHNIVFNN